MFSLINQFNSFLLNQLHCVQYYDSVDLISIWGFTLIEFQSLFHIPFNYLDSDVIPFPFYVEDVERRFQSYSDKHDWFGLDLTQNTRGRWCPNIPGGSKYSGFPAD